MEDITISNVDLQLLNENLQRAMNTTTPILNVDSLPNPDTFNIEEAVASGAPHGGSANLVGDPSENKTGQRSSINSSTETLKADDTADDSNLGDSGLPLAPENAQGEQGEADGEGPAIGGAGQATADGRSSATGVPPASDIPTTETQKGDSAPPHQTIHESTRGSEEQRQRPSPNSNNNNPPSTPQSVDLRDLTNEKNPDVKPPKKTTPLSRGTSAGISGLVANWERGAGSSLTIPPFNPSRYSTSAVPQLAGMNFFTNVIHDTISESSEESEQETPDDSEIARVLERKLKPFTRTLNSIQDSIKSSLTLMKSDTRAVRDEMKTLKQTIEALPDKINDKLMGDSSIVFRFGEIVTSHVGKRSDLAKNIASCANKMDELKLILGSMEANYSALRTSYVTVPAQGTQVASSSYMPNSETPSTVLTQPTELTVNEQPTQVQPTTAIHQRKLNSHKIRKRFGIPINKGNPADVFSNWLAGECKDDICSLFPKVSDLDQIIIKSALEQSMDLLCEAFSDFFE
ncbi:MAG: hypothetical protein [brine shrimp arlivirus 3]|nr:MAG: hypothetical protein [brine shrimp arlivirus 3]